jgi:hypothetical protein
MGPANQQHPYQQPQQRRRRAAGWVLTVLAGLGLLGLALWLCVVVLPARLYPPLTNQDLAGLSPAERAERVEGQRTLQNDARTTLLQGLGAVLVLAGASLGTAVAMRQVRVSRDQLEQARQQLQLAREQDRRSDERAREQLEFARQQAHEQLALAQESQITERFTRAVDQLGSDQLDLRLGGIYALERIAADSATHRLAIFEILTAFIRIRAPWPPTQPGQYIATADIDQIPTLQARAPDLQAAITVLGRRHSTDGDPSLDLRDTDLRRADLAGANLAEAVFDGASLAGAVLDDAILVGATMRSADLTSVAVRDADLREGDLRGARLDGTSLHDAQLAGAWLDRDVQPPPTVRWPDHVGSPWAQSPEYRTLVDREPDEAMLANDQSTASASHSDPRSEEEPSANRDAT